jgi:putative spermidine/putrescine transport system permease protein
VFPVVLWPACAYLLVFHVLPLARLVRLSVTESGLTLTHYRRLIAVPMYAQILTNTFEIAASVAVIALLLGYPTAYFLATTSRRRFSVLIVFVLIPFFTSLLVRNYAWIFLLGSRGVINSVAVWLGVIRAPLPLMFNRFGVLVGMVHILLPFMILILLSVMRGINSQLLQAAASLASPPFTAFRRVFLPLSLPGVGGGFLLVFVLGLAFFVTPAMLGGPGDQMLANTIATQVGFLNWGFASALAVMLLAVSLLAIGLMQWLFGGIAMLTPGLELRAARRSRVREGRTAWLLDGVMNPIWRWIPPVVAGFALAFLFVPIVVVVPLSLSAATYFMFPPPGFSLQWYRSYFASSAWLEATWNSVQVGLLTTALSMAMAVPAALGISRSRSRLTLVFYGLILSPMLIPGVIMAIAIFFLFSGLGLTGTIWGVALGHTIGALPLAVVVLVAALQTFDRNLERAAQSLGTGPFRTTIRVTLPILSTAVFTAALFAFLHSFDELLIALFVSGIGARTLPKKMWESLQEINPTISAVSTLLVLFTAVSLLTLHILRRVSERRRTGG